MAGLVAKKSSDETSAAPQPFSPVSFEGATDFALRLMGVVARGSSTRLRRTFAAAPPWAFARSRICSLSPSRLRSQNHTIGSASGSPSLRWVVVRPTEPRGLTGVVA